MGRPHLSIAGLMAVVVIVAVDCAVYSKFDEISQWLAISALGAIPVLNALALGGLSLARGVIVKGECGLALVRFDLVAGAALVGFFPLGILYPDFMTNGLVYLAYPFFVSLNWILSPLTLPSFAYILMKVGMFSMMLSLPQLAPALVAAWLGRGRRVRITIEPREVVPGLAKVGRA